MGARIAVTGRPVTGRDRLLLLACVGVAVVVSACQTAAPFRPEDPQSLIGEWSGESTDPGGGIERWSGENVLTIARVEGDRVFGTLESWCGGGVSCAGAHTYRTRPVQRTLRGNELKIGPFDVVVDGVYMTGRRASTDVAWLREVDKTTHRNSTNGRSAATAERGSGAAERDGQPRWGLRRASLLRAESQQRTGSLLQRGGDRS